MNLYDKWEKALKNTRIIRPRVQPLHTFASTNMPYIFLAESEINPGDTVVRKGEVVVQKPALILPSNAPQFEGFDFEGEMDVDRDMLANFLLVRGIYFPSYKYDNKTYSLEVFEGPLNRAIGKHHNLLQRKEDVQTGLLAGPGDIWQLSVIVFICSQVVQSSGTDIRRILDEYKKKKG